MGSFGPYCLVLSGGGAKGMYHIGVWRALQELGITVNAFIGNSIGAVIGAVLAQGLHSELERIGDEIHIGWVMNLPDELVTDGALQIDRERLPALRRLSEEVLRRRSLDTRPFRELIEETLDEDAIRQSGNDFAVVTMNLSDLEPREVFLEEMERGELLNYVLASAAFPGFEKPVIGGKKHIDGGFFNNLPYNLATGRGYKNIIVSDIAGLGINRKINPKGTNTVVIRISADIGGILDFDRDTLGKLRQLGYLDTMKTFGKLLGNNYFLKEDPDWEKVFDVFLEKLCGANFRKEVRPMLPTELRHERRLLYPLLDSAATSLGLDRIRVRTYPELCEELRESKASVDRTVSEFSRGREHRRFIRIARRIRRGRREHSDLERSPYFYLRLFVSTTGSAGNSVAARLLRTIYPELEGAEFILSNLERFLEGAPSVSDRS